MKNLKSYLTFLGVAVAVILTLAACSRSGQAEIPSSHADAGRETGAEIHENLPSDIQITIYQGEGLQAGEEVSLSKLMSQGKPVILNFYAGLCPPCRLEMPDLQEVYDENQETVLLLGLDIGPFTGLGSRQDGQALLQELRITYPAGTTSDQEVIRNYRILGMPSTYFINPEGEVVHVWTGILTREKTNELLDELLSVSANP
jgi:thiol-disulfide isomerase/thioredoxin